MFEANFFDTGRLFGIYHPAEDADSDRLLVVCPPLFDEYRRCYRALAELAKGCAAGGTHVFRFDYFGTGESWGTLEDASVEIWLRDIQAAIAEGLALSGARRVYLLGVRFGGTLAAQIQHPGIVEYIFWDLVNSGENYLACLARVDAEVEAIQRQSVYYDNIRPPPVVCELFHLSQPLRQGVGALHADLPRLRTRARVYQVVGHEDNTAPDVHYGGYHYDWPTYHDGLLLPKPVLETIARRLA
jgi:hypothetical protein